jgi:periplasmic protein CpxP/Spy
MMVISTKNANTESSMQLKSLSLIVGAIALTLTATPYAVKAQTTSPSTQSPATETPRKGHWQKLGLTDAQKTQIQGIRRNTRTKIEAVLTPEQAAKFKAEHQEGRRERGREAHASLNLTDTQKTQIRDIRKSSQAEVQTVLTPEQQAQMKQFREAHPHKQGGDRSLQH